LTTLSIRAVAGAVAGADACAQIENPACGDVLKLTLKLCGGRIEEIRFLAKGCVAAMACGSALTELVRGRTVEEAHALGREELVRAVGGLLSRCTQIADFQLDGHETMKKCGVVRLQHATGSRCARC
jgi:NifU-like protein involved in Fe-S cluster formation